MPARIRAVLATVLALLVLSGCSKPAVDAGEEGGIAFIAFAGFLIVTCIVMWWFLGRND